MSEFKYTPGDDPAESWMRNFAARVDSTSLLEAAPLPDPQLLWWKAQALRRLDAENRAHATLERGEKLQVVFSIIAAIALFAVMLIAPSLWAATSLAKPTVIVAMIVAMFVAVIVAVFVAVGVMLATWRSHASADSGDAR